MRNATTSEIVLEPHQAAKYLRKIKKMVDPAKVLDLYVRATVQGGVMVMATLPGNLSKRFRLVGNEFVDEITIGD